MDRIAATLLGAAVFACSSTAAASERAFFRSPPTTISIHAPASNENQRNRTTISVQVPEQAGRALQQINLMQISGSEAWDWGRRQPQLYLGSYGLRRQGRKDRASIRLTAAGRGLTIRLKPPIPPGEQVNLVFGGITPEADIYMWTTSFVPAGNAPLTSVGPTLRQHVYRSDNLP